VQKIGLAVDPTSGALSNFQVQQTIVFRDALGNAFDGLNPLALNGSASNLGRSFDPEGFVVNPKTGSFYVADEYGPSLYEFSRGGQFVRSFQVPSNLVPKVSGTTNYVATRDDGLNFGRQDNRGYEGLTTSPDGTKLYAIMQDPPTNDGSAGTGNNGRNGRNVRIVEFATEGAQSGNSTAQYVYRLEAQADVAARINAAVPPGSAVPPGASATDPRQGRNIGVSAITAISDTKLLVLERDNRGLGVDDPTGANGVGSKRVYVIDLAGATDVGTDVLPLDALPAGVVAVGKGNGSGGADPYIDVIAALGGNATGARPGQNLPEKLEGLTIGPRLADGSFLILMGTDNDYSVTQFPSGAASPCGTIQCDVYIDANGNVQRLALDAPPPAGYSLIPGYLFAFKTSPNDPVMAMYMQPVPEPSTYAMLLAGFGLLGFIVRRRLSA
jgi:hypothetical protein